MGSIGVPDGDLLGTRYTAVMASWAIAMTAWPMAGELYKGPWRTVVCPAGIGFPSSLGR